MKRTAIMAIALAAAFVSFDANAANSAGNSFGATNNGTSAGLAWRCGKNNPAMWGTFGNGCLKQKRKAKNAAVSKGAVKFKQQGGLKFR